MRRLYHALRLAAVAVPVLWLAQQALFGPNGYRALRQKQAEVRQAQERIQVLEGRNRQLNQAVHALSSDPTAIEGIAREQLHLTRPGEVVYTYPVAPGHSTTSADASLPH